MPREQLYLAAMIVLLVASIGSSIAAVHFYQLGLEQVKPRGSLGDDGSWGNTLFPSGDEFGRPSMVSLAHATQLHIADYWGSIAKFQR